MLYKPGELLIAPPGMIDPRFRKAVLLITYDGLHGTQALCLNKETSTSVNTLIKPLGRELDPDQPLFWGGPVATTTLWMLHDKGWECDNTLEVNDDWAVSSSTSMFAELGNTGGPHRARFYLGLANWAPGQLEMELSGDQPFQPESSWLTADAPHPDVLFNVEPTDLWNWACELSGTQAVSRWL